jgi:type I restriction enzyme S subunit
MTFNGWAEVPLGEVLMKNEDTIEIVPTGRYLQITVRLWGKGVVPRGEVMGMGLATGRRFRVSKGQFILSRIDARHGAFGIVPELLDGAIATNDFPSFKIREQRLAPGFLAWFSKTHKFVELCRAASEGTTNRVRLKEDRFLQMSIPLPEREEQERIVAKLDNVAAKVKEAHKARRDVEEEAGAMLHSAFARLIEHAPLRTMADVAPLVRREVEVRMGEQYPELGIRSFGKGTFHKPALDYLSVGTKRLYRIEPGDLLFSNVFAWEGAIAVAQPEDEGRVGSHRFITCVPKEGIVTAEFLRFYFLTEEGLRKIGEASPGGAGRNRTLGLKKLAEIEVPVPDYREQLWFDRLQAKVREMLATQQDAETELDAMLPSALDKAFKGELSSSLSADEVRPK